MTVSSQVREATSLTNGFTRTFPCPFQYLSPDDLEVVVIDAITGAETLLALGSGYTIGGDTDAGTSSITTYLAWPAGYVIRRRRVSAMVQPYAYTPNDGFPAASHEAALDRTMLAVQERKAENDDTAARAPLLPANPNDLEAAKGLYPQVGPDGAYRFAPAPMGAAQVNLILGSGRTGRFVAAGGETAVTVSDPVGQAAQVELYRNGVRQIPLTDYAADGTRALALAAALDAGEAMAWIHTGGYLVSGDGDALAALSARVTALEAA